MPYPTLYPPQTNSPATELLYDISASQTNISVPASAVLPAAPCPLVIGFDDDAETVLCIEVMSVEISGQINRYSLTVTRAFEGVAKAWSAGTPIARNLAAYDIRSLQEWVQANREAANNKITGGYGISIPTTAWTQSGNFWVATITDVKIPAETATYRYSPYIHWNAATMGILTGIGAWAIVETPAAGGSYIVTIGSVPDELPDKPEVTLVGEMTIREVTRK